MQEAIWETKWLYFVLRLVFATFAPLQLDPPPLQLDLRLLQLCPPHASLGLRLAVALELTLATD